jgi:5'(3')-deoxyribonucleotidase
VKIGLDMDGVLADLVGGVRAAYEEWFAEEYQHGGGWSLSQNTRFEDDGQLFRWLEGVPDFWESLPPTPGAMGGVWQLLRGNHQLVVITNRSAWAQIGTRRWLEAHWPRTVPGAQNRVRPVDLPRVEFVAGDKSVIDCQIYVDDNPDRLKELKAAGRPVVYVFDQSWNKGAPGIRVRSWADLVKQIRAVAAPDEKEEAA